MTMAVTNLIGFGSRPVTNLITNGGFDSAASWSNISGEWTLAGGVASLVATSVNRSLVSNMFSTVAGQRYVVHFQVISGPSPGRFTVSVSSIGDIIQATTTGLWSATFTATSATHDIGIRNTFDFNTVGSIDNVVVSLA